MKRFLLAGLILVVVLPRVNADTFTGYLSSAQSPPSDFFGDIEVIPSGLLLSETGVPACTPFGNIPFPLTPPSGSNGCEATDTFNLNATFSADGEAAGPLFLLSVIVLPQPSDEELPIVQSATSAATPQKSGLWLLIGASSAIALIGGTRVLKRIIAI